MPIIIMIYQPLKFNKKHAVKKVKSRALYQDLPSSLLTFLVQWATGWSCIGIVQLQPSNQDPTRQSWRNPTSTGDQGKRRENGSKSRPVNMNSINVERAQNMGNSSRNTTSPSPVAPVRTPKSGQFLKSAQQQQQQQTYVAPKNSQYVNKAAPQPMNLPRSPTQLASLSSRSSPPRNGFVSRSPPKLAPGGSISSSSSGSFSNSTAVTLSQKSVQPTPPPQQQKSSTSVRPTPKPLNLTKSFSTSMQNFARVPQTATFPPKVNRALNLPQPPKTATFPKSSSGFPKDIRQGVRISPPPIPQQAYTFIYGDQTYIQTVQESPRIRRYSATPAPLRFVGPNYRQVELGPGTPVVVLSHPEDSDSQGSSPPTPGYLPEGYGQDIYDLYQVAYEPEEIEDNQYYYYYSDYPQEYPPQTPTGISQPRSGTFPTTTKDQRRRSVIGGPMKVHPDAVLPIRQPKGPDMTKNFATRIRRKAVNKLYAAAAERRSKSAADRRKSAMF
ncbi:hypothetical protein G9A89_005840 [Geosiphon pyriformis]|nr:hypothetical protein G9A89_005840 [Geosiphon pyriformis]